LRWQSRPDEVGDPEGHRQRAAQPPLARSHGVERGARSEVGQAQRDALPAPAGVPVLHQRKRCRHRQPVGRSLQPALRPVGLAELILNLRGRHVDAVDLAAEHPADPLRLAVELDSAHDRKRSPCRESDDQHRERDPEGHPRTLTGRVHAEQEC